MRINPTKNEIRRFFKNVKKTKYCWIWNAGILKTGYGGFHTGRGTVQPIVRSHRYSWIIHNGQIPDGLSVLHRCDNRRCVNPKHLWIGNTSDNMRDASFKGRINGENAGSSKLKTRQVNKIRLMYKTGKYFQRELSDMFKISLTEISNIVNKKRWAHI